MIVEQGIPRVGNKIGRKTGGHIQNVTGFSRDEVQAGFVEGSVIGNGLPKEAVQKHDT